MSTLTVIAPSRRNTFFLIAIIAFGSTLFVSCGGERKTTQTETLENTTVEGSLDWAQVNEVGNSSIKYNAANRTNVIVYTETTRDDDDDEGSGNDAAGNYEDFVAKKGPHPYWGVKYGLEYIGKGAKFPFAGSNNTIPLNYLEVPLDLRYHYPLGPGYLHAGLGPYFAYGIGGSVAGTSVYGENNGGFKRFDAGLNFQVGYNFHGVVLDLSYDLGLANIEYADEDVKGHNRVFSINFGYQIGRLFKK